MKTFSSGVTQFENKSGSAALSFEGMEQLVKLLEPHKDKKLRDKEQWVCLMKEIWEVLPKVTVEAKLLVGTIG